MMYLISTELEPDDILLFYEYYDILGINKKQCDNNAFDRLVSDLKQKKRPPLFLATRNFEKIYQVCLVSKLSKSKELLFDNQIDCINFNIDTFVHVKTHKITYTIHDPVLWPALHCWKPSFLKQFTKQNTLYYLEPSSDLTTYLLHYMQSLLLCNSEIIQHCSLMKMQPVECAQPNDVFILQTSQIHYTSENISIGIDDNYITPGSWVFLQYQNEIYKLLHVTRVKQVARINTHRFINSYYVIPFTSNWTTEIEIDVAFTPRHFTSPSKWNETDISYQTFSQTIFECKKPAHSAYLNNYISAFLNKAIPPEVVGDVLLEQEPHNHFHILPVIFQYERIYVLSSAIIRKLYNKLTINDEDLIYLDLNPLLFFKVNVDKWATKITKQFLEDVKNGCAHIFITTKKHERFFISMNVANIEKYKSKDEKLLSPYACALDHRHNADMYGNYGVLPLMLKAKQMWNINGHNLGQNVKHYNEISHVFNNVPKNELMMFSAKDTGDKLHMFGYLKAYLLYQTLARANNVFTSFSREEVSTYSDVIEPQDYGLKLKMWNDL